MDTAEEHIVMLPFMAHGHLIPFLALARQIHQTTNFTITIATTPLNIAYLRSAVSSDPTLSHSTRLRLAALPFNSSDHNLPPNTENTESLPLNQIINLFHSSAALEPPSHRLVADIAAQEGRPPICIVSDVFNGWASRVAERINTTNVSFSTGGAYGTAAYMSVWLNLPHKSTDTDEFPVPGFPDSCRFHRSMLHQFIRAADGTDSWSRFFQTQISLSLGSSGWLCNTAEEVEVSGMEILRKYIAKPVWSIGPLLPPAMLNSNSSTLTQHSGKESGISTQKCVEWLDSKPKSSVVYISFGSQNTISSSQMMELAKGLEQSGKPFIWVVRPPVGFDQKGEFRSEWLPKGFEDRVSDGKQGLLVRKWAPQSDILRHKSTAVFLSHCGWNSVMEGLSQGVPIIGWPLAAEQAYNAKMMVDEMGVCVELARGVGSGVEAEEVRKVVELVTEEGGKGGEMRRKAVEIGETMKAAIREEGGRKGSSLKAMDDFVSAIVSSAAERRRRSNGVATG
ncbi:hypothetical protein RHSIM_Rhsim09G0078400 [Rhododendron simsii]|uniref:Glycosyltransferase n=1 Tax=Rhododendron simsii TaxID=118357 RepID=A0A834LGQ0_RHOSS|nr:hypothetical protein RHSIM_Rhsim09G0078400 [Rhododendron simsii]